MKRRQFLDILPHATAAGAGYLAAGTRSSSESVSLPAGLRIVFQGDSITDAGRDRGSYYANQAKGMGGGYVYQIVSELLGTYPKSDIQCFNRGISGHKVFQLRDRWDIDCLSLKPDVLSILIGVNDYWHVLNGHYDGTAEIYQSDLRQLLQRTKDTLPDVKLILGEPFAVAGGRAIDERWDDFAAYRRIARELAGEFRAAFVPYHDIFADALQMAPASYWCPDGVHPSIAGAHLMKEGWLKALATLF